MCFVRPLAGRRLTSFRHALSVKVMTTAHRIRLDIHLRKEKVPAFFSGCHVIQAKQAASTTLLPALPVTPATLLGQITAAEGVHLQTKTTRGLIGTRTTAINLIWTSLESNLTYCQGLCDSNPSQGLVLADASGYHITQVGTPVRELIGITLEVGQGIAHLKANVAQFPAPSGKKSVALTWLWRHSLDGGKTIVNDDPFPTGKTTITGLPLGVQVNFSTAVKDTTGTGPWSMWIPAFVH
jgi:hypothetical protein